MFGSIWNLPLKGGLPEARGIEWGALSRVPAVARVPATETFGSLEGLAERVKAPQGMGWKPPVCFPFHPHRESLPLPHLKQEGLHNIPSLEPPRLAFQYVLCAASSPAVKQQEETLTYPNQGMPVLGKERT